MISALLGIAALLGEALIAVAGGGSFICFPALILTATSCVAAHVTSTASYFAPDFIDGSVFTRR